jgi:hypothetical protein
MHRTLIESLEHRTQLSAISLLSGVLDIESNRSPQTERIVSDSQTRIIVISASTTSKAPQPSASQAAAELYPFLWNGSDDTRPHYPGTYSWSDAEVSAYQSDRQQIAAAQSSDAPALISRKDVASITFGNMMVITYNDGTVEEHAWAAQ